MTEPRKPELRIVGGHPALDLVNTVAPRVPGGGAHLEYLESPADLLAWALRIGVVDEASAEAVSAAWQAQPATAGQALRAALDIRESAYTVLSGSGDDIGAALDRLALRWAAAAARSSLVAGGGQVRLVVGTDPALSIPDRLAHAAVELLRTVDAAHLKACPLDEGGCGWLFLDQSRNGSRRWCAMADCGAQAKARKLTARRRASRATSVTP
ncbi:CGNR zinc finger domain-containing protein [Micromonospora sp. CPCC 205371]|nr:CGNR zinc finger domain-containing protein [Micromonospora sp. CPCC 205371]